MALPENIQYRILNRVYRSISSTEGQVERLLLICAYATLLGKLSESNLVNLCSSAGVDIRSSPSIDILRYYVKSGFIEIVDEGKGVVRLMNSSKEPFAPDSVEAAIIKMAKQEIDSIRREMLDG
jgi:hypothetical protein